jgi:hypothetical protein
MKRVTVFFAIFSIIFLVFLSPYIILPQEKPCNWEVYFSPKGGCTDAVIRELDKAKSTILIQTQSAQTHLPIHKPGDLFKKNFETNIWKTFNLKIGDA